MLDEENYWKQIIQDYNNSPADGIRGKGGQRRQQDIAQDENLRALFREFEDRAPLDYLRAVSYRLHF